MTASLTRRFLDGLQQAAASGLRLGLAVSGGGDSMAMLHLAADAKLAVRAVTLDHGVRPDAAAEAVLVGVECARLGIGHDILQWQGWKGQGNLQDQARRARRTLIAEWAVQHDIGVVTLAHTRDDLAETFLMRLGRGAGVDGLSAMSAAWQGNGITWLRPLLTASRGELRSYLRSKAAIWVEDPSNENTRFDRIKARKAIATLGPLGITAERLAEVAGHLAEARDTLEAATDLAAQLGLQAKAGSLRLDRACLAGQMPEIRRRLVQRAIGWIAPSDYGPRGAALQQLLDRLAEGKSGVLAGCRFVIQPTDIAIFREAKAVEGITAQPGALWDGRWQVSGPFPEGSEIKALGAGLLLCANWRATGLIRAELQSSPAVWQSGRLIAAPLAGFGPEFSAKPLPGATGLHHSAIVH